jgi:uroporphyrinogen decarboxylase
MTTRFARFVHEHPGRLGITVGAYAGLKLTGASVQDVVTNAAAQTDAAFALHETFQTAVLFTAMDLSAEAEAFGSEVRLTRDEIPTVVGRRVTTRGEIDALPSPRPGDRRTAVHLDTTRELVARAGSAPVIGCLLGPFSLAGRLFGVSETLEATAVEPGLVLALLEKTSAFLADYASAFRAAGTWGVFLAEPMAGLLSPRAVGEFSTPFVWRIRDAAQTEDFTLIYHNCGARLVHLAACLAGGAEVVHFSSPMDIVAALKETDGRAILGGNLDPASVFLNGTPDDISRKTAALLEVTAAHRNFIISSGCDLPPGTPLANLEAFYRAVADFNDRTRGGKTV